MTSHECAREHDVVNAVLAGNWPERCSDELVAHAAGCEICREVAGVAVLLRDDLESSRIDVHVPAAGQVWWRAAVRARLESTHAAAKPITWMHAIMAATTLGVFLAVVTALWPKLPLAMNLVRSLSLDLLPGRDVAIAIAGGLAQSVVIGVIAAGLLVVAPLALYFVLTDD